MNVALPDVLRLCSLKENSGAQLGIEQEADDPGGTRTGGLMMVQEGTLLTLLLQRNRNTSQKDAKYQFKKRQANFRDVLLNFQL